VSDSPVRVLVVDDSPSCRALLVSLLDADPRLTVVGIAADGESAVAAAAHLRPDVITMDIHLPGLDGFGATRRIMETCPTRIVMVTASSRPGEIAASFEALASGALTVIGKPVGPGDSLFEAAREELCRTVALMAEVKVVRRWPAHAHKPAPTRVNAADAITHDGELKLVAVGASTGGPLALQILLSNLKPDFGAPLVIVQHISPGFADGLVEWLGRSTAMPVRLAAHGEATQPGVAYIAPEDSHTTVRADGKIALSNAPLENGFRPAVACLFSSVAVQFGRHAAGLLLTGMGADGARELKAMRDAGALTMVQDRASAAVHGMPGEALRLHAAVHVMPPEAMARVLNRLIPERH
jgi:two-component system chemotaxis response regulator CheB